jgi:hypothetical protein
MIFFAETTETAIAYTCNGYEITGSASASATSSVSYEDALAIATVKAKKVALINAENSVKEYEACELQLITYEAEASGIGKATSNDGCVIETTGTATATSTVSKEDALKIAKKIANQVAQTFADSDVNLLNKLTSDCFIQYFLSGNVKVEFVDFNGSYELIQPSNIRANLLLIVPKQTPAQALDIIDDFMSPNDELCELDKEKENVENEISELEIEIDPLEQELATLNQDLANAKVTYDSELAIADSTYQDTYNAQTIIINGATQTQTKATFDYNKAAQEALETYATDTNLNQYNANVRIAFGIYSDSYSAAATLVTDAEAAIALALTTKNETIAFVTIEYEAAVAENGIQREIIEAKLAPLNTQLYILNNRLTDINDQRTSLTNNFYDIDSNISILKNGKEIFKVRYTPIAYLQINGIWYNVVYDYFIFIMDSLCLLTDKQKQDINKLYLGLADIDVLPSSSYNSSTQTVTIIKKNIGNITTTGFDGYDYNRIFEVTQNIDESIAIGELAKGTPLYVNGQIYYAKSTGNWTNSPITNLSISPSTFSIQNFVEQTQNLVGSFVINTTPLLKPKETQTITFTLNTTGSNSFTSGATYIFCGDDTPYYKYKQGDTKETIDDLAVNSNNFFVFTVV